MVDAGTLFAQIAAVAPVLHVRMGAKSDRKTWTVTLDEKATLAQRAAADAVVAAFDVSMETQKAENPTVEERLARIGLTVAELKAALQ